jgi:hypothetical protein
MMKYFKINRKLDSKTKHDLIWFAKTHKDQYYNHLSTTSNSYTNLNFLFTFHPIYDIILKMFPVEGNNISLLQIDKNKEITPHTDGVNLKRNTVIVFPLWPLPDQYTPCVVENEEIPYYDCYAFNTQKSHWIQNNDNERISLQIFYDISIEDLYDRFKQFNGLV